MANGETFEVLMLLNRRRGRDLFGDHAGIVIRITGREDKEGTMVTGAARPRRGRWRGAKSRRKVRRDPKDPARKTLSPDEALNREQPDRLLLSALNYWEVERDLIEERLAALGSATAAS